MKDCEINEQVCDLLGMEFGECGDYCNDPAAWGELIQSQKIDVSLMPVGDTWFAGIGRKGADFYAAEAEDERIGRAVCLCFIEFRKGI